MKKFIVFHLLPCLFLSFFCTAQIKSNKYNFKKKKISKTLPKSVKKIPVFETNKKPATYKKSSNSEIDWSTVLRNIRIGKAGQYVNYNTITKNGNTIKLTPRQPYYRNSSVSGFNVDWFYDGVSLREYNERVKNESRQLSYAMGNVSVLKFEFSQKQNTRYLVTLRINADDDHNYVTLKVEYYGDETISHTFNVNSDVNDPIDFVINGKWTGTGTFFVYCLGSNNKNECDWRFKECTIREIEY